MRKPALGDVPVNIDPALRTFLQRVKENIEAIEGRRGVALDALGTLVRSVSAVPLGAVNSGTVAGDYAASALTLAEVISKVNEIIELLQG